MKKKENLPECFQGSGSHSNYMLPMENTISFLKKKKKKIELPDDPAIPLLGIYSKKKKNTKYKK